MTYDRAAENVSATNVKFGVAERPEPVRELPWESAAVNARVDELMAEDELSFDAAVTAKLMIVGGTGDDTIVGGNGSNIIVGADGDDNLEGGASRDLIIGGAGRDSAYGAGGADTIAGGADGDSPYGGAAEDFIVGEGGDDYIDGGRGNDLLRGGAGSDTISGGYGRDVLRGEDGKDTLIGASGTDSYVDARFGDTVIAEGDEAITRLGSFGLFGATVNRVEVDDEAGRDAVSIDPNARGRITLFQTKRDVGETGFDETPTIAGRSRPRRTIGT